MVTRTVSGWRFLVYAMFALLHYVAGYDQCEVLGHNYRLLDGIETDTSTVSQVDINS